MFLDTDEFAVEATFGAATINVVFDEAYSQNLEIAGSNPVALAKADDVAGAAIGSTITIGGTAYKVSEPPQPDGTGMVRLELELA